MDRANLADVLALARTDEERDKVALFDPSGAEVFDPYYGGEDGFTQVREQVREVRRPSSPGISLLESSLDPDREPEWYVRWQPEARCASSPNASAEVAHTAHSLLDRAWLSSLSMAGTT